MSFEAIAAIGEAEARARQSRAEAAEAARAAEAAAEAAGRQAVGDAVRRAEEEIRNRRAASDAQAMAEAEALAQETENKKAVLRARAETRSDKAAALIVERIVNG